MVVQGSTIAVPQVLQCIVCFISISRQTESNCYGFAHMIALGVHVAAAEQHSYYSYVNYHWHACVGFSAMIYPIPYHFVSLVYREY